MTTPEKSAQHTAGPWHADYGNGYGKTGVFAGDVQIGAAWRLTAKAADETDDDAARAEGNALMFAASLELLTALVDLRHTFNGHISDEGCGEPDGSPGHNEDIEALKAADAAIARATGQAVPS